MGGVEPPLDRRPADVPQRLDVLDAGAVLAEQALEDVLLEGIDASDARAHDLCIERGSLRDVSLSGTSARGLILRDVVVTGGSWANLDAQHATLRAVECSEVRGTGANLGEAKLTDVLFQACRLDLALFRFAKLERVVFVGCRLDEADFYGASLSSVRFESCSLVAASFDTATFSRSEVVGGDLTGLVGVASLGGVRMAWPEIVQIAGLLAEAQGIDAI